MTRREMWRAYWQWSWNIGPVMRRVFGVFAGGRSPAWRVGELIGVSVGDVTRVGECSRMVGGVGAMVGHVML
jgi:hypothetical protein